MFNITLKENIEKGNVRLVQDKSNIKMIIGEDKYSLTDDISYIKMFCKRLDDLEYDNVLILGLGLGTIPFYMENFKGKTNIDVVEVNGNVIKITSSLKHLKSTNIILSEPMSYIPNKKYDLIIYDLWWDDFLKDWGKTKDFFIQRAKKKHRTHLTENGKIYVPILDLVIDLEN